MTEAQEIERLAAQVHALLHAACALSGDEKRSDTLVQIIEDTERMALELTRRLEDFQ